MHHANLSSQLFRRKALGDLAFRSINYSDIPYSSAFPLDEVGLNFRKAQNPSRVHFILIDPVFPRGTHNKGVRSGSTDHINFTTDGATSLHYRRKLSNTPDASVQHAVFEGKKPIISMKTIELPVQCCILVSIFTVFRSSTYL